MGTPQDRAGRNDKAFTPAGGNPAGWVSETDCGDAGLHDAGTWNKVKNISVGDLMMLSGFHERSNPRRNLPDLDTPEGASIIRALENHTGMNYYTTPGGQGGYGAQVFHACCCCIG